MYRVLAVERRHAAGDLSCWRCSSRCSPGSRCPSPARSPGSSRCSARRRAAACMRATTARPATRTALLMPTYNELPARIMAGLQAIDESLRRPARRRCVRHLHPQRHHRPGRLDRRGSGVSRPARTHRRRMRGSSIATGPNNTARKAGNIAEWVRRFGGAYPQFLILDADSVMRGETLVALVARDGSASRRRPDPDAADHHRRHHAVRPACSNSPAGCTAR